MYKSDTSPAWVYCANGLYFKARCFSGKGTRIGEIVFNTSLSGYQEIITDPSYAGQFVVFSMPEIGIVGANELDSESRGIFSSGMIVRHYENFISNFRATQSLKTFLDKHNTLGICDVDTRALVKMIRTQGAMMSIISTEISDKKILAKTLESAPDITAQNHIESVSTPSPYTHTNGIFDYAQMAYSTPSTRYKVAVIDFGAKHNILNELVNVGLGVTVLPYKFNAQALIDQFNNGEIHGVFLSNGPGDPKMLTKQIEQIKLLIATKIPIFGICLGHQLLSLAYGYETHKLKFGHHGGNHPVKNLATNSVEITAQNHIYSVPEAIANIADITHRNLFDNTIEGVAYKDAPIFSVQHHPEASPGPRESRNIFERFAQIIHQTHKKRTAST